MRINPIVALCAAALSMSMLTGFGLGDLSGKVQDTVSGKDCSKASDKDKCKKEAAIKGAAIGVAAELIRQLVVEFTTTQTATEKQVVEKYKEKNKKLPEKTLVTFYRSNAAPGKVVKAGNSVAIDTEFEVIPGKKDGAKLLIEESFAIYDNEDNTKLLKSLTKEVNKPDNKAGSFKNEFKFNMPVGLPQGVYPIKTALLVNKKAMEHSKNDIQLVLNVLSDNRIQIAALQQ